jgi:DNA invertase Pin-like site-specific DNA recombinase
MVAAMPSGKRLGYIRVSGPDQNTVRQLDGVSVDKVQQRSQLHDRGCAISFRCGCGDDVVEAKDGPLNGLR